MLLAQIESIKKDIWKDEWELETLNRMIAETKLHLSSAHQKHQELQKELVQLAIK